MKEVAAGKLGSVLSQRIFRILIVDDNIGAAKILAILFAKIGQTNLELVHTGEEAIAKAEAFLPEIVILDLVLGRCSGFEVARTLRQSSQFQSTFLIALSGNSSAEDRAKTAAEGFDLHLAKPIGIQEVEDILSSLQLVESGRAEHGRKSN